MKREKKRGENKEAGRRSKEGALFPGKLNLHLKMEIYSLIVSEDVESLQKQKQNT